MTHSRIERMHDDASITSRGKLAVLTLAAAAAAILVALTSMSSGELTASGKAAAPAVNEDFVYFPGQYVNKAAGPSEAVQGF